MSELLEGFEIVDCSTSDYGWTVLFLNPLPYRKEKTLNQKKGKKSILF